MIFDSCIWVGLAANQVDRQAVIDAAGDAPVFTSTISLGELNFGVQSCTDPTERAMRAAYLRQVESRPAIGVSKNTAAAGNTFAQSAGLITAASMRGRDDHTDSRHGPAGTISGAHSTHHCYGLHSC